MQLTMFKTGAPPKNVKTNCFARFAFVVFTAVAVA
jgi:hypothetical protein